MKILTIFNRESVLNSKKRKLLYSLSSVITVFAIVTLIIINNIVVEADINSYINYEYVRLMIKFDMFFELWIAFMFSSIFLSGAINIDKNNLSLRSILSAGVNKKEIILGKYINGLLNTFCIVTAGLPIAYLSLFFGGYTLFKIISFLAVLIGITILYSAITLFISSRVEDRTVSLLISLMFAVVLFIILLFSLDYLILRLTYASVFAMLCVVLSIFVLKLTENSKMFMI